MAKYKLTLRLPHALKNVPQRILEGHDDVVVTRDNGYVGELTDEQLAVAKADPYLVVEKAGAAADGSDGDDETPKQPTKKELLARAAELGVEVPKKATVPQITELIAKAEAESTEDGSDGDDETEE